MVGGWSVAVLDVHDRPSQMTPPVAPVSRTISSALLDPRATSSAFITDAMLAFADPLRGYSGAVHTAFRTPGERLLEGKIDARAVAQFEAETGEAVYSPDFSAPERPGIYRIAVQIEQARRAIADLRLVTLVPISARNEGRIGRYHIGVWPFEGSATDRGDRYAPPVGFVEVTPENRSTPVSEHFRLGDFLTKGQADVWPKYLILDPKLLDKLELVIQDLKAQGHRIEHVAVMSGFRTPTYNRAGGNVAGRASLSRHMYGDAADIFVDNDRNGWMDDLNGDGRTDTRDAEVIAQAAERVERKYPALVGGVGIYKACCGHGPFTHVDVRGYRARWRE